jgi:hypothetical protein
MSTSAEYQREWKAKHPGQHYKRNREWRLSHPEGRNLDRKRYYNKSSYAKNYYRRWVWEEIQLILYSRLTDSKLSKILGRSVQSIQIKRCKYNKEVNNEGESKS